MMPVKVKFGKRIVPKTPPVEMGLIISPLSLPIHYERNFYLSI